MNMNDYPRLLVIDFDYFFPNPLMMAEESQGNAPYLYDWSTFESPLTAVDLWPQRAASFLVAGKELPRCNEGYEEFWNRFAFEGNPVFVSDSNVYAGIADASDMGFSEDAWSDVWLFDAHHDCYGSEEAFNPDVTTCANWMHAHHRNGSKLHVRYPAWRADVDGSIVECEAPPGIPVDRQIDDGTPMGFFDQIMICRSGAWVPPWCDDQFEEFIHTPGFEVGWIEEHIPRDRKFSMKAAEKAAEQMISPEPGINSPQVETASDWQIGTLRKVKQALDEYCHSISIKELRSPATLQGELLDTDFTFALAARPESVFLQFSGHKGGKPLPVQTFNLGPAPEVPTPYSRTYEVIVEHIVYLIERSG